MTTAPLLSAFVVLILFRFANSFSAVLFPFIKLLQSFISFWLEKLVVCGLVIHSVIFEVTEAVVQRCS